MATTVVTAKFVADTSSLSSKLTGVQGQLQKTGTRMQATGAAAATMGRQMTMAALPIVAFGALAAKAFVSFDDKMTQSLAIMTGVTSSMRTEMEKTARTVSTTFGIAADKAAESYFFLASAGLDAEQAMAALPQVAAFAKAGMFDMATATDLATDAQSSLGLTVKDATANLENLTRVTDVLVKANTLANATVEQFSTALTTKAGASLKAVNKDVEEGVAVLAALADQGIKSQLAGNQLAIVMRDLQTKAIENKDAFAEYGLTVFDASGNMKNMADIIANLEQITAGMSDEQKRASLGMLGFSDRSLSAMTALFGTSDAIRRYEQELRNAGGTTQDVSEKQMQSMSQQIEILKTRFMDLALGVGSVLVTQFLTPLVSVLDSVVTAFSAIPDPVRNVAISLGLVVALTGPMLWMFGATTKALGGMMIAFAQANARVMGFATRMLTSFKAVGGGAKLMAAYVGASLTSTKIALEVAGIAAQKFKVAVVFAVRAVGNAFKGLLASLGPIGIALIAAGAAFEIFSGKSAAADQLVTRLKDSVDELTGAFGEATAAAISSQFRTDISSEDITALRDMGVSISDMTQAAMAGGDAADAYATKLQELIDQQSVGDFFSGQRDLLITAQRNFQGMAEASANATLGLEADAAARADAMAIEGRKAWAEIDKQIANSRAQAITRAQDLANMTASEKRAMDARIRAADAAIAKDSAMTAVTEAAKTAVTALETAMTKLSGVIGNQNSRNAAIRSTRELSKTLDENGKKITGTSEAAMKNQDAIAASASSWIAYAEATNDPIKQQKRLADGEAEIRAAIEKSGGDPDKSPIVKQFKKQLEKSQETVDEFKKRATEAKAQGIKTGENFMQGILEGLRAGAAEVEAESVGIGESMYDGVNEGLDASSPSKKGMQNAKNFIDGIILGLKADKVMEKASDLAKGVVDAFETEMARVTALVDSAGEAGIGLAEMVAKPFGTASQIMKNFGKDADVSSVVSGVRSITDLVKQAYAPLLDQSIVGGRAAKRNRKAMNAQLGALRIMGQQAVDLRKRYDDNVQAISDLEEAYGRKVDEINGHFDGLESAAQASLERIEKYWAGVIPGLEGALAASTAAFARENDVLNGLIKERDSFLGRIADGFRGFVNNLKFDKKKIVKEIEKATPVVEMRRTIKEMANGIRITVEEQIKPAMENLAESLSDEPLSGADIKGALEARLAEIRSFASNIRSLTARGVDSSLIQEFISSGVEGAGEIVTALAGASDAEIAGINAAQAELAAQVAEFQTYATQQWFDAGIAQQQAVVAPLEAAKNAAQAALDLANVSRETELTNARAHLETLRKDRAAALAAAKASHDKEVASLTAQNLALEVEMDALAQRIDDMVGKMAMTLPPKAFAAGQKSMRQLRAGFVERFPAVKGKLNNMMDNLAASMNRQATVVVTTVQRTIFDNSAGPDGKRALGGPVLSGKTYLVGERGPELLTMGAFSGNIIPNDRIGNVPNMAARASGGGGTTIVNINVQTGIATDPAETGRQVVEAIRKYERRSGQVFVSA